MTRLVFLILLPAIIVIAGTWAWRYQMRVFELVHRRRRDADADLPQVRLTDVVITGGEEAALFIEHADGSASERIAVALDVPSIALSTLQAWHDDEARLLLIDPPGRKIVRFRRLDEPEVLTLRRVDR